VDSKLTQALRRLGQLAQSQKQGPDSPPPASPEFGAAFNDLLAQYGQRATYELDLGWPRYQEDPSSLLNIIRRYAYNDGPAPESASRSEVSWSSLISQASGLQRWLPWRCALAAPLVSALQSLLIRRDELNDAKTRAIAACRRWDLALGQQWVKRGWLAQPEDIFWLTFEEIERALMVEGDAAVGLSSTVQARKETYQTYAETKMPYRLPESQIPLIQLGVGLSSEPSSDVLVGLPISPGQVRGTILVLRHPDEFKQITDDIILVTPSTDPAWLSLLHLVSGLIVEMGGLLSHGSVIAREYGLPAVANIANATQQFRTGDTVLVDGSTGVVQLLEPAQRL
jgi:pyruvate,water dikinase